MAKPIEETPILHGKDAINIINKMNQPPTEKQKELKERIRTQRKVRF